MLTEIWILKGPRKSSWHSFLSNGLPKSKNLICYDIFLEKKKREDPSQHAICVLRGPLKQAHHLGGPLNMQIACWEGSRSCLEQRFGASQHANCVLRGVRRRSGIPIVMILWEKKLCCERTCLKHASTCLRHGGGSSQAILSGSVSFR